MTSKFIKITDGNELTHFGVKGMRWGHHKKAEPIHITNARSKLTETKSNLKKATREFNRSTGYGMVPPSKEALRKFNLAAKENKFAKQDLTSTIILNKLNSKPKSKTQLAMEEEYKKKGMSDNEASVAAYQNIRTKKILAAVGGTALAVGAGYAAYKIHDSRVDKIIKAGTTIQNISGDDNKGIRDAFYASSNTLDRIKYKGIYGSQIRANNPGTTVVKKEIKALADIKQASFKNAKNSFEDLLKNDQEFADDLKKYLNAPYTANKFGITHFGQFEKAKQSLNKGILDKNLYETFNTALVDHDAEMQKLTDKYFSELSKRGYNAIKDINDVKYSGYKAINPIIAFNTQGKVDVVDIKQLADKEINKAKGIAYTQIVGSAVVAQGAIISAAVLGSRKLNDATVQKVINNKVAEYVRDNPTTKMTTTEIARMIERSMT